MVQWAFPLTRNRPNRPGSSCRFFATQALTSKFVPNMLAGGKAVGVFLHALRLPDGSGYKVILEAAPEAMYSTDTETSCAAMSKVVERYVRAYPSQYMWSMKRFKKRPPGEDAGTEYWQICG